jgi:hypothetical protein
MFFKDLKDLKAGNTNAETGKNWTLIISQETYSYG